MILDCTGYCMYSKRLMRGRFRLPKRAHTGVGLQNIFVVTCMDQRLQNEAVRSKEIIMTFEEEQQR